MIERLASGSALTVAAAATTAISKPNPTIWHFLGYPFEAAGMIAALFACGCARWWSGNQLAKRKTFRWTLDMPVTAITFAAAMGAVIALRPDPIYGLLLGAGVGVIGEGLFKIAQKYAEKFDIFGAAPAPPSLGYAAPPEPAPKPLDDLARQLDGPDLSKE